MRFRRVGFTNFTLDIGASRIEIAENDSREPLRADRLPDHLFTNKFCFPVDIDGQLWVVSLIGTEVGMP